MPTVTNPKRMVYSQNRMNYILYCIKVLSGSFQVIPTGSTPMTSPEATSNTPSLQIESLLRQQGPVSVYKASVGSEEHLFYFYANPSEHSVQWLKDVLTLRT